MNLIDVKILSVKHDCAVVDGFTTHSKYLPSTINRSQATHSHEPQPRQLLLTIGEESPMSFLLTAIVVITAVIWPANIHGVDVRCEGCVSNIKWNVERLGIYTIANFCVVKMRVPKSLIHQKVKRDKLQTYID